MKKILISLLLLIMVFASSASAHEDWMGVWGIWGDAYAIDTESRPWYKGTIITRQWQTIEESSDNDWQWSTLDSRVADAVDDGHYIIIKIYVGAAYCPDWMYEGNGGDVTEVVIGATSYPYYLDPDFMVHFKDMVDELRTHIDAYATATRAQIVGVQAAVGISGDPQPWNTQPSGAYAAYEIDYNGDDEAAWEAYSSEMILYYVSAFASSDPEIIVMAKPFEDLHEDLVVSNPTLQRKVFSVAQGYQASNEMDSDFMRDDTAPPQTSPMLYGRGELDDVIENVRGWWDQAFLWNYYWHSLWMLTYGVDILGSYEELYIDYFAKYPELGKVFNFFNKYAGYKDPASSPGAWIALRDGLDCNDWSRFSAGSFGDLESGQNPDRYAAIAAEFADHGAIQGDASIMNVTVLNHISGLASLNDVGWDTWDDNYRVHMTQYSPLTTSVGWWRVGSTSQPYGRYARGFEYASDYNTMSFDLADTFYTSGAVEIRVVYYDSGVGTWQLQYDGTGGSTTAYTHTNTGTNTWRERSIIVTDAAFNNGLANSMDIILYNDDDTDEKFHMVEVTKKPGLTAGW